jgi:hypothetical protein
VIPDAAVGGESAMAKFQDALGDYYDAGMIGEPPRIEDYRRTA